MNIQIDINTYRSKFSDVTRQYLFYMNIVFPGFGNVLQSGLEKGLSGGTDIFENTTASKEAAMKGLEEASLTGIDVMGMKAGTMFKDMNASSIPYYVRSANLPSSSFDEMTSNWMGNSYKLPGNKTYEDWTVTFNLDAEGFILKRFYDWQKMIRDPVSNYQSKPSSFLAHQEAYLLNGKGDTTTVYKLYYAWPKIIGQVQLDYSSNEVATVDVTFSYQFFNVYEQKQSVVRETIRKAGIGVVGGL